MSSQRRVRPVELAVVATALTVAAVSWAVSLPARGGPDDKPATFRVAAVQMYSRLGEVGRNRARMTELTRRAAARGADVVVFPEAAVPGYVSENFQTWTDPVRRPDEGRSLEGVAETAEGETARFAAGLARDLRIYLAAPFIERDTSTGRYYNSVLLASPDGEIVGRYRKISPWPRAEATWASPGDSGLCIVETEFGRLGVMICYDSHSVARRLAEAGATTVLVPTAWVGPDPERWFGERLPAMARQLGLNLVAANWRFPADRPLCEPGAGCSKVIAADGRVLAGAQGLDDDEIVVADLPIPTDAAYGRGVPPPAGAVRP